METLWNIQEALIALKEGHIVQGIETPILIQQMGEIYRIQHPNWHSKMKKADLIDLFKEQHFILRKEEEGIDQEKDEDYYRWRARYL